MFNNIGPTFFVSGLIYVKNSFKILFSAQTYIEKSNLQR